MVRSLLRFIAIAPALALPAFGQSTPASSAPAEQPAPAYLSNPKFVSAIEDARKQEKHNAYVWAVDDYKKASKIAGGKCAGCLERLITDDLAIGSNKDAINASKDLLELDPGPSAEAFAQVEIGRAMVAEAGSKPKPAQLEQAHQAFQAALADNPRDVNALFSDGQVLALMGQLDQAKAEFTRCAACVSSGDPARVRAQHFAEDPELATHKMAPPFEVTALDGSRFNLDNMTGHVVLIDFWATWCGPCNQALPEVQKIASEFAGQPLTIISISWDSDETKWKQFIQSHHMTWVQYRDADHKLSNMFGVDAIPHYFTIDSDGVLTSELVGADSNVEGKLKKLIARARETQQASTASPASGSE